MAKSKSTTTPTESSSSKTKDNDHTGGHRSSRTNVNTRSTSAQSSPLKRKADDHDGGSRSSKKRVVADNNATSSTSQQATPVKAVSSKRKGKEIALSEPQSFKNRHPSIFGGVEVKRETPEPDADADADADNICIRPPSPIKPADREKVLDYVLLGTFGFEARQHAVDQLFEAARESAASKADFGVTCVEATVSRLKRKGIKEQRLTEVLAMLQDGVYEQVRARVEPLGGPLPLPRARVDSSSIATRTRVSDVLESRRSPVVVPHPGKQRSDRSESVHTPSDFDSSSDDDETIVPSSQRKIVYREDDDEEYQGHVKHEDGMISF
jgi:hypothetical protein